jgi:hypothetical protein
MSTAVKLVVPPGFYYGLGPVQLDNVLLRGFRVPANKAKMQAWLDLMFAGPSGGQVRYEVIGSHAFLSIAEIAKMYQTDAVDRAKGWTNEIDAFLWVPARRGLFAYRCIPVYLFVDSGAALAAGREIWGFPKQLGRFVQTPAGTAPGAAREFRTDAFVVSPFSPETQTRWAPVIELKPSETAPASQGGEIASIELFVEKILLSVGDEFAQLGLGVELASAFGANGMTMSFLKQLPDVAEPTLASYQSVVEAKAVITKLRSMGLTDNSYQLRITSYDSQPFFSELGIRPDWQEVGQGVWVEYDFEQHLGQEIWRAA